MAARRTWRDRAMVEAMLLGGPPSLRSPRAALQRRKARGMLDLHCRRQRGPPAHSAGLEAFFHHARQLPRTRAAARDSYGTVVRRLEVSSPWPGAQRLRHRLRDRRCAGWSCPPLAGHRCSRRSRALGPALAPIEALLAAHYRPYWRLWASGSLSAMRRHIGRPGKVLISLAVNGAVY